jgi:hypothetical protein
MVRGPGRRATRRARKRDERERLPGYLAFWRSDSRLAPALALLLVVLALLSPFWCSFWLGDQVSDKSLASVAASYLVGAALWALGCPVYYLIGGTGYVLRAIVRRKRDGRAAVHALWAAAVLTCMAAAGALLYSVDMLVPRAWPSDPIWCGRLRLLVLAVSCMALVGAAYALLARAGGDPGLGAPDRTRRTAYSAVALLVAGSAGLCLAWPGFTRALQRLHERREGFERAERAAAEVRYELRERLGEQEPNPLAAPVPRGPSADAPAGYWDR